MSFVARCFPAEISKTGRYTNVVCCAVKILHSEQNPGPSAAPNSFWGERTACLVVPTATHAANDPLVMHATHRSQAH